MYARNLRDLLDDLCALLCGCGPKIRFVPLLGVASEQEGPIVKTPQYHGRPVGEVVMAFQLTDSQKVLVTVLFKDKKGNPAVVDGAPTWLVDNTELVALAPSDDGLACSVSAVGPLGTALVSMTADADLGEGVIEVAGTFEVEILSGAAVTVELTPGTPEEQ